MPLSFLAGGGRGGAVGFQVVQKLPILRNANVNVAQTLTLQKHFIAVCTTSRLSYIIILVSSLDY